MRRRAFVVVLDACGIGALPDADEYGDAGANTLAHLADAVGGLKLPCLQAMGLGCIDALAGVAPVERPSVHGRLRALGPGKDTIAGHWELMGVVAPSALPTFPHGFPAELMVALRERIGRNLIGNKPSNGITILDELGPEHLRTGALIVYTSADSVLQIAAHEEVVGTDELYAACATARDLMQGEFAVGRVIARPFRGHPGDFERTEGRRDYALSPPSRSYMQELQEAGVPVHSVGKVAQVFAGVGIDEEHPGATNAAAIGSISELIASLNSGLVFANLVETDQVYGHRKDVQGFHRALQRIDDAVGRWRRSLHPQADLLVLTADHGVDPTTPGTDHTREYAPLLATFGGHDGRRHDGVLADVGASVLRWLADRDAPDLPGDPFVP